MPLRQVVNVEKRKLLNKRMREIRLALFVRLKLGVLDDVINKAIEDNWNRGDLIECWIGADLEPLYLYEQLIKRLIHRRHFGATAREISIQRWKWLWGRMRDRNRWELYKTYDVYETRWVDE